MKKNILLMLALLALGTQNIQARTTKVNLVNWSSNYNIAVLASSGKWVQIPTKTEIKDVEITTTDSKLQVRACDKTSTICGFSSKGDFTWNGKQSTALDIPNTPDNATLILDAGNSLFSGIEVPSDTKKFSATKTVQEVTFLPNSPVLKKINQSVKVITPTTTPPTSQKPNIPTPPPAPTPSSAPQPSKTPTRYVTKAQFDAAKATLDAKAIIGLSEKEMYWLFGIDAKGTHTNPTVSNTDLLSRSNKDFPIGRQYETYDIDEIYKGLKNEISPQQWPSRKITPQQSEDEAKALKKVTDFHQKLAKQISLAHYDTKAQFDAGMRHFDAKTILNLSEKEMYWLFGFDAKGTHTNPTLSDADFDRTSADQVRAAVDRIPLYNQYPPELALAASERVVNFAQTILDRDLKKPSAISTVGTKEQFDAAKATFGPAKIATLSKKEMYWLFGLNPIMTNSSINVPKEELIRKKDDLKKAYDKLLLQCRTSNYDTKSKAEEENATRLVNYYYHSFLQQMK